MLIPSKMMVCGACLVPVVSPIDPGPDDQVVCPKCGQRDRFADARAEMYRHIEFRLKRARLEGLAALDRKLGNEPQVVPVDGLGRPVFRWRVLV